jgi:acetate kinase
MYALPYEGYTEHKVRRYGFPAPRTLCSGQAIQKLVALGMKKEDTRVTCHLGNGSSYPPSRAASYGYLQGLTPLEGYRWVPLRQYRSAIIPYSWAEPA